VSPELAPVIARLEAIDDPIERAIAANEDMTGVREVRDQAMREAWADRRAGTTLSHLARTVGVSRAAAAIAVSRGASAV
jgi:hypothetical protein